MFGAKKTVSEPIKNRTENTNEKLYSYEKYEQLFIEKAIEILKKKPDNFSARWCIEKRIESSVLFEESNLLIMDSGQIIQPISPKMTQEQKEIIQRLIEPIFKKDSICIIENFLNSKQ